MQVGSPWDRCVRFRISLIQLSTGRVRKWLKYVLRVDGIDKTYWTGFFLRHTINMRLHWRRYMIMPMKYSRKVSGAGRGAYIFQSSANFFFFFFSISYSPPKMSNKQDHHLHCGGHKQNDGEQREWIDRRTDGWMDGWVSHGQRIPDHNLIPSQVLLVAAQC